MLATVTELGWAETAVHLPIQPGGGSVESYSLPLDFQYSHLQDKNNSN